MQSVTKTSYMHLAKLAILQSAYKKKNQMKKKSVCDYKSCQSTKSAKSILHSDENCQDTKGIHMWPVKPAIQSSNMWSMTKPNHMQLPKPAMKQSNYKKYNQDDKNCQYIKKHSYEKCPMRPVCDVV